MEYINMDKRFKISKMLIWHFIFLLLFAIATKHGTDALGFDSANSCNTNGKTARRGRAHMLDGIPCDLTRQAYCHLPGSAYPWHAVRRFVHENHGLMKRMYGDVRHISVLRDEIFNNEINVDDVELAAERYSKDGQQRTAKFMHNREDFVGPKSNDVLVEPHFRPVSTTATTTTTITATATATATPTATATTTTTASASTTTNGSRRRPEANSSNSKGNNGSTINLNKRRIGVVNRWEPNRASSPTRPQRRKTTAATSVPEELDEQEIRKTVEEIMETSKDDGNLESNIIYEVPTSPETDLSIGDNIQIVESPQLGNNSSNSEPGIISTTLKVANTVSNKTAPTPTTLQKLTQIQQQRPTVTQRQPQQPNSTVLKESSDLKMHEASHESERIPSTTTRATATAVRKTYTAVKGSNNQSSIAIGTDAKFDNEASAITAVTNSSATSETAEKSDHTYQSGKTTIDMALATIANPSRIASITSSTTAAASSAPTSHATESDSAPASVLEVSTELLIGEKFQKPPSATTTAAPATVAPTKPVLRDGQLYQDTMKPEVKPAANARSFNACPVKEEVVAPFWANNTRGEVLALLNLYPFEQYVHWEKCTHEHRQMFCRDGCRCEQQYRLHRLLAYDPQNECRGIFSDWFRFPSCCICKCYGIPMEFRGTSRSPRAERGTTDEYSEPELIDQRHPIDVAEETVRKAIYEHATEDWYRPKDEFDFYEG